jgi:hypothetical protein
MYHEQGSKGIKHQMMEEARFTESPGESLGTIQGIVTRQAFLSPDAIHDDYHPEVDNKPTMPIKDAKVSAECSGFVERSTMTNDSGFYKLTDLEDGKWSLKVEVNGYKAVKATVKVSGGGIYTQDFEHP